MRNVLQGSQQGCTVYHWREMTDLERLELLVDDADHLETLSVGDRVDEDVSVDSDGMLGREERILVLAGSIDDRDVVVDTLEGDLLEVWLLDGRIVGLDEVVLDKLDNKR